ncbi:ABC transporter ATP-binding protein [Infirmifilum sp. NZ]|uniref:ABC transporter ATP-binding protein n=1 Tax=Infirmifilum sp. NZ TaxID=2926850 RepID=UPI0027A52C2D|nr:ABC transporter ATP-binding protein [Infirmifilum sp. NZ]UNQ73379.1 ABC transporter ATP-binding protein [Infirmifilum sp. NZ]
MPLEAQEVSKSYDGRPVLKSVSLIAERGQVTCLIGPNGSGKTTLLRILALLEKPDSGRILLDGEDLSLKVRERAARIAYMPQRPVALTASVYGNVYLPLRASGVPGPEASKRAKKYLDLLGLTELEDKPAQRLSGGQRQLLAIARALALEPDLLLLDEPTSHLDPSNASKVRALIREYVKSRSIVAVIVSHSPQEVAELSDKTVLLFDGAVKGVYTRQAVSEELLKLFHLY